MTFYTQGLKCSCMNRVVGLIWLFYQHLPFSPPAFAGCLTGEARNWPVRSGSDLFLFVLTYYKVVLLKMYLAQKNIVKSQLAKISRKLCCWGIKCLGCSTCLLHMNEPIHKDWKLAWKGYTASHSAHLNWHICWKQRCQKCDSLGRSGPRRKAACHLIGIKILSGCWMFSLYKCTVELKTELTSLCANTGVTASVALLI